MEHREICFDVLRNWFPEDKVVQKLQLEGTQEALWRCVFYLKINHMEPPVEDRARVQVKVKRMHTAVFDATPIARKTKGFSNAMLHPTQAKFLAGDTRWSGSRYARIQAAAAARCAWMNGIAKSSYSTDVLCLHKLLLSH
jgi:hypothetical protein